MKGSCARWMRRTSQSPVELCFLKTPASTVNEGLSFFPHALQSVDIVVVAVNVIIFKQKEIGIHSLKEEERKKIGENKK